ncbi:MAG: hypothetical protein MJZ74_02870 [Muribaculaceae bacterium]|nr:hypothetical protein [Muribaculaceae bacterium]
MRKLLTVMLMVLCFSSSALAYQVFHGRLASKNITLFLDGNCNGYYYYDVYRKNLSLSCVSRKFTSSTSQRVSIQEYDQGYPGGRFFGTIKYTNGRTVFSGTFTNQRGNKYKFTLTSY